MTGAEFNKLLNTRILKIRSVLEQKAGDYARTGDRLGHLKRTARVLNCSTERACLNGFAKHLVSILNMVDETDKRIVVDHKKWDEKVGDAINYLILLEATVKESSYERKSNVS